MVKTGRQAVEVDLALPLRWMGRAWGEVGGGDGELWTEAAGGLRRRGRRWGYPRVTRVSGCFFLLFVVVCVCV